MKHKRSWWYSFVYAGDGLRYVILTQRNMKIHILAAFVVLSAGVMLDFSRSDWVMVIGAVFFVLFAEVMNTAVEKTIDMITLEYHPLARIVKNLAAGAVLLAAIYALIVAYLVIWPYILAVLQMGVFVRMTPV